MMVRKRRRERGQGESKKEVNREVQPKENGSNIFYFTARGMYQNVLTDSC